MDNITMIEKLREKADISYKTANEILEGTNWDIDAAETALRKEGLIKEETAMMTTKNTNSENSRSTKEAVKESFRKAAGWIGNLLHRGMDNNFCVDTKGGKHLEIPVTIMAIITIAGISFVPVILLIAFFAGCSFSFSGPDLGKENINSEMAKIKFTSAK